MDYIQEQKEEIESLKSIYPDEFSELSAFPPAFMIRVDDVDRLFANLSSLQLKISFPANYPDSVPFIEIPNRSNAMPIEFVEELLTFLRASCKEYIGMPMVFSLVDATKEWMNGNAVRFETTEGKKSSVSETDEDENSQDSLTSQNLKDKLETANAKGGRWNFVIGLIGKPSAGKSTFFNAATHQNVAKTGAHPFTTIEPNIGQAFYSIPCPCSQWGHQCQAKFGHSASGERFVPVLLKDVAGLVPGACEGRGQGNKFLSDLLDADVLVHIIDVSGQTDEVGKPTTEYDPTRDVEWIHQELHRWIYDNIMDKWDSIRKKPTKLFDMFTGYHTSQALIQLAFESAGITDTKLMAIPKMENMHAEHLVHKLVAEFLRLRFPILLALNKVDLASAMDNADKFKAQFGNMAMVSVSAKSECFLQQKCKEGVISYQSGSSHFDINNGSDTNLSELEQIKENVLQVFGDTGVLQALSQAVSLRSPTYAFPVKCLNTCQSISAKTNEKPQMLRDCFVLKPGTTVGKLFDILLYPPVSLLAGEYVRAEGVDSIGMKKVLHKSDLINVSNQIVKIMSTKKPSCSAKSRS